MRRLLPAADVKYKQTLKHALAYAKKRKLPEGSTGLSLIAYQVVHKQWRERVVAALS